jgi:uncharacterized OsmC-like protein
MADVTQETLTLLQVEDYRCSVNFGGGILPLTTDEPPPLGSNQGPSPVQLLLSAVANCLTASLLFALRKYSQEAEPLSCHATANVGRNEENRLRVLSIEATLTLGVAGSRHRDTCSRILDQFEGFCTVTRSVAQGIPVNC